MTNAAPAATAAPAAATAPTSTEQQPPAGTQAPAAAATPAAPTAPAATTDQQVDVAALQAENARLQKEAENARVAAKAKVANDAKRDQLLAVAAALGIDIPKGEEQTVESLQQKLTDEANARTGTEQALNAEKQARAIDRAAWTNQIAPEKAAYLNFLLGANPEFTKLDPASSDYQTSVSALVKTITDADPYFAATPGGAARSGAEAHGGAGAAGEVTPEAFNKMGAMERTKLFQTNPELFKRLSSGGTSS